MPPVVDEINSHTVSISQTRYISHITVTDFTITRLGHDWAGHSALYCL